MSSSLNFNHIEFVLSYAILEWRYWHIYYMQQLNFSRPSHNIIQTESYFPFLWPIPDPRAGIMTRPNLPNSTHELTYFKSRSSGLWRRVVLWQDINFSEVQAASIFTLKIQGGVFWGVTPYNVYCTLKIETAWTSETSVSYHNTTSCRTSEDDLNLQDEDGGSMDLRNVGILPQHYTASQPIRPRLEISAPCKPRNSYPVHCSQLSIAIFKHSWIDSYKEIM
jgi:hypothetical protein